MLIPTKRQWTTWSLPSRLTALGTLFGFIGVVTLFSEKAIEFSQSEIDINYDWYIGNWVVDVKKTQLHIPEEVKEFERKMFNFGVDFNSGETLGSSRYMFVKGHGTLLQTGKLDKTKITLGNLTHTKHIGHTSYANFNILPISYNSAVISITKNDHYWPENMKKIKAPDYLLTEVSQLLSS